MSPAMSSGVVQRAVYGSSGVGGRRDTVPEGSIVAEILVALAGRFQRNE